MARDVFQHHLENQAGHRIQVAGEGLAAEPQRLQRNRTPSRKRIHHQGRLFAMRRLYERPAHVEMGAVCSVSPVGEVGDEGQQSPPQFRVTRRRLPHRAQNLSRLPLELVRAVLVARVRQQQGEQDRPRGGQRPPRPPQVQGAGMPVANRLLPRRVPGNLGYGKVHLGKALALAWDHADASDCVLRVTTFFTMLVSDPLVLPSEAAFSIMCWITAAFLSA